MPELAADITPEELEKDVRDELRSLPNDLANMIACHLVAAERALGDDDAELAYEHAKVARRFAARIGVVREAVGLAAYRAGHYAEALSDLRAARRMTGVDEFLPIMADCERGLGRPERALDLVRSPEAERLDRAGRIELAIVESGARRDLGQYDAAVITLQRVPELRNQEPHPWSARLTFAYADALAEAGHESAAIDWFERAMTFDEDGETEAAERYAQLTGAVIEDIEEDEDEDDGDFVPAAGGESDMEAGDSGGTSAAPLVDDAVADGDDDAGVDVDDELDDDFDADGDDDELDEDAEGRDFAAEADAGPGLGTDGDEAGADVRDEPRAGIPDTAAASAPSEVSATGVGEPARAVQGADGAEAVGAGPRGDRNPGASDDLAPESGDEGEEAGSVPAGAGVREPDAPVIESPRMEIGVGPAFIEPDFGVSARPVPGDVLDDEDDDAVQAHKPERRDA
ncbi:hypothetical protein [Sphaerisporangium dianthi]|uniref:Replicase polyprotein 1ab n=1 Tax=Sphaerisporangium dianthi TaxID=1436120 RepID=A0ABV9CK16_9ACTN